MNIIKFNWRDMIYMKSLWFNFKDFNLWNSTTYPYSSLLSNPTASGHLEMHCVLLSSSAGSVTVLKKRSIGIPMLRPENRISLVDSILCDTLSWFEINKRLWTYHLFAFSHALPNSQVIKAIKVVVNFDSLGLRGFMIALYLEEKN